MGTWAIQHSKPEPSGALCNSGGGGAELAGFPKPKASQPNQPVISKLRRDLVSKYKVESDQGINLASTCLHAHTCAVKYTYRNTHTDTIYTGTINLNKNIKTLKGNYLNSKVILNAFSLCGSQPLTYITLFQGTIIVLSQQMYSWHVPLGLFAWEVLLSSSLKENFFCCFR